MRRTSRKKPLFYTVYNNAGYYSQGAALLYGNIFGGKKDGSYIAPGILCSTFCIELLLKCLLLIKHDDIFTKEDVLRKKIKLNEHRYSQLFEKIDVDLKEKILLKYNELSGKSVSQQGYIGLLKKLGDYGFVEWRYVYEEAGEKKLDIQLQNRITHSLGKCIESILKEKQ